MRSIENPILKIYNTQSWYTLEAETVQLAAIGTFKVRSSASRVILKSLHKDVDTKDQLAPTSNNTKAGTDQQS